jgi:hypothetical protein
MGQTSDVVAYIVAVRVVSFSRNWNPPLRLSFRRRGQPGTKDIAFEIEHVQIVHVRQPFVSITEMGGKIDRQAQVMNDEHQQHRRTCISKWKSQTTWPFSH